MVSSLPVCYPVVLKDCYTEISSYRLRKILVLIFEVAPERADIASPFAEQLREDSLEKKKIGSSDSMLHEEGTSLA